MNAEMMAASKDLDRNFLTQNSADLKQKLSSKKYFYTAEWKPHSTL